MSSFFLKFFQVEAVDEHFGVLLFKERVGVGVLGVKENGLRDGQSVLDGDVVDVAVGFGVDSVEGRKGGDCDLGGDFVGAFIHGERIIRIDWSEVKLFSEQFLFRSQRIQVWHEP